MPLRTKKKTAFGLFVGGVIKSYVGQSTSSVVLHQGFLPLFGSGLRYMELIRCATEGATFSSKGSQLSPVCHGWSVSYHF
jgi:hypothetical protein